MENQINGVHLNKQYMIENTLVISAQESKPNKILVSIINHRSNIKYSNHVDSSMSCLTNGIVRLNLMYLDPISHEVL